MRKQSWRPAIGVLAIVALVTGSGQHLVANEAETVERALSSIRGQEALDHVKILSADELEGRDSGSVGERKAAAYIAGFFSEWGLEAVGDDGTYFQGFTIGGEARLGKGNSFSVKLPGQTVTLEPEKEFVPFGFSSNSLAQGSMVFCGYGITSEEPAYDDYAGLDVAGRIVVILRHEPQQDDPESAFDGRQWTRHAWFATKARNAQERGAAALIIVNDPLFEDDELAGLAGAGEGDITIPVIHLTAAAGQRLLQPLGKDLEAIQRRIDQTLQPITFELAGSATLVTDLTRADLHPRNVVGLLPGSDPELKDEVIVVGAHYDHVGYGHYGSRSDGQPMIHNGADDNASGTSVVLELAQALSTGEFHPRRSVLFILFSGEERGLLGSQYYVEHPLIPVEKTVAMINLDMVGRGETGAFEVSGIGTSPLFPQLLTDIEGEMEEKLGKDLRITYGESGVAPSDNTSFYRKEIPVLFFFTGLHEDYHMPSDDWPKVNPQNLELIGRMALGVLVELGNGTLEGHAFTEAEPAPRRGRRGGPFLGIQADRTNPAENGVRLSAVVPESGAAQAGLQPGDIITAIDGQEIGGMQALVGALQGRKVGDTLTITVLRGEERLAVEATLGSRR